ncbi:glycoside hydrolase family 68 protein [Leuconostoc mesenteroides]|uniref:glycoside hydrolase family 68 protein n=1 Tax=Leuconostoc mesenteroides TaxID=1245 RepID=UPI000AFCC38F|nr:glycoside hydrolase family 68 protein [Leuconostoc mesenteroides]
MRKKLYKAGKLWVAGAAVAAAVVVAPNIVSADTTNSTTTADATTTSSATESSISSTESDDNKVDTSNTDAVTVTTNSDDSNSNSAETSNSDAKVTSNNTAQKDEAIKAETTNNQDTISTTAVAETKTAVNTSESESGSNNEQLAETATDNAKVNDESSQKQSTPSVEKLDDSVSKDLNSKTTVVTKNADGTSTTNMTYANLKDVADNIASLNPDTSVPYFNADAIKNLPAMTTADAQTGQIQDLDVWDSWALQDAKTGAVANYHGYNIVFALAGYPKEDNDQHIYMLYTKYSDTALNNWKNAGPVFGFNAKWNEQQWSGSATVNDDDSIQLFYTKTDQPNTVQRLATANLSMTYTDTEVYVAKVNDDHVLFAGDGEYYQTLQQWVDAGYYTTGDNFTMRDPHVIEVNGERYLAFEANTGTNNYQSDDAVNDDTYYGGTEEFNQQAKVDTLQNPDKLKLSKKG